MNQVLTLEKPLPTSNIQHPFLQELIGQIRLADTFNKYCDWSDELILKQLIISLEHNAEVSKNLNLNPVHQLLNNAFYQAIGNNIQRQTGHSTETYVHLRNREFSSAVIFCGGVLVLNSLISGYKNFKFLSIQELIETAEKSIHEAVIKASYYLDF